MSYIGRGTESISNVEVLDNLTFDGSASYTLQKSSVNFVPSSANNLLISISGVVQQGNFSVSGSTITFDTTVSGSDTCDWILHYGTGLITTPADGTVTEAKLGSNAVTTAKINNGAVSYAKTDGNFGKIGQVVSTVTGTEWSSSATTSFSAVTNLTASITPTSTSSKIYITCTVCSGNAGTGSGMFQLRRDASLIYPDKGITNYYDAFMLYDSDDDNVTRTYTVQFLDSPSSTSSLSYQLYGKSSGAGTTHVNRSGNNNASSGYSHRMKSVITLMEVLA